MAAMTFCRAIRTLVSTTARNEMRNPAVTPLTTLRGVTAKTRLIRWSPVANPLRTCTATPTTARAMSTPSAAPRMAASPV